MNKYQKLYIAILTPVAGVLEKAQFSTKIRNMIIGGCSLSLALVFLIQFAYKGIYRTGITYHSGATFWDVIGSLILVVIIIFAAGRDVKPLKSNRLFCLFYFGSALLIFVSCFFHYVGEGWRPFSLTMLFVFPAFYFICMNAGCMETVLKYFSWGLVIGGCVLAIASLVLYPPDFSDSALRYSGITINSAYFALNLLPAVIGCMYIAVNSINRIIVVCMVAVACLSVFLIILTGTRSPLVAAVAAMIVTGIIALKKQKTEKKKRPARIKLAVILGIVIAVVAIMLFLNKTEAGSLLLERLSRFDLSNRTVNDLFSGRWSIWADTLKNLNFLGHDFRAEPIVYQGELMAGVHNIPLDVAYRSGIAAGVFYLLMEVYSLIFIIKKLISKLPVKPEYFFAAISIPAFFIVSMFEWDLRPFTMLYNLCFFISLGVIMFVKDSDPIKS